MSLEETEDYPSWRPHKHIRLVVIGIAIHDEHLLVMPVFDDSNKLRGWRPPGGGVEFGEMADAALKREFQEEFDLSVETAGQPKYFENIYQHEGHTGHELVIAYPIVVTDALASVTSLVEGGHRYKIEWRPLQDFTGSTTLFPEGLLETIAPRH